jgi:hypothetical protein
VDASPAAAQIAKASSSKGLVKNNGGGIGYGETKRMPGLAVLVLSLLGIGAANAQSMNLTSAEIKEGGSIANEQVFKGFGCTGNNVSPSLSWSGAPSGTKSFAVSRGVDRVRSAFPYLGEGDVDRDLRSLRRGFSVGLG